MKSSLHFVILKCRLLLDNIGGAGLIYLYNDGALHCYACGRAERGQVAEQKAACTLVFGVQAAFGYRKTQLFGDGKDAGLYSRRLANMCQQ